MTNLDAWTIYIDSQDPRSYDYLVAMAKEYGLTELRTGTALILQFSKPTPIITVPWWQAMVLPFKVQAKDKTKPIMLRIGGTVKLMTVPWVMDVRAIDKSLDALNLRVSDKEPDIWVSHTEVELVT